MTRWMVGLPLLLMTAGCTAQGVVQGIYDGARVRTQIQSAPSERLGKPELPSDYQSYDAMRRKSSGREITTGTDGRDPEGR